MMGIKLIFNRPVFPVRRLILRTSTYVEKILSSILSVQPNVRINYTNLSQTKKAPTGTFFKHLISQSTIANIMAVEAI